jgi:hypothetical protein
MHDLSPLLSLLYRVVNYWSQVNSNDKNIIWRLGSMTRFLHHHIYTYSFQVNHEQYNSKHELICQEPFTETHGVLLHKEVFCTITSTCSSSYALIEPWKVGVNSFFEFLASLSIPGSLSHIVSKGRSCHREHVELCQQQKQWILESTFLSYARTRPLKLLSHIAPRGIVALSNI